MEADRATVRHVQATAQAAGVVEDVVKALAPRVLEQ